MAQVVPTNHSCDRDPGTAHSIEGVGAPDTVQSRLVAVWLGSFLFICFYWMQPHWDWNQNARLDLTVAIVNHSTFTIDRYQENTGDKDFFRGHYYVQKPIGQSLAGIPVYLGYKAVRALSGQPAADSTDDLALQEAEIVATCAIPVEFFLIISMFQGWWGGLAVGPRYLTPLLPFLATPVIFALDRLPTRSLSGTTAGLAAGLFALSFLITWAEILGGTGILLPPEDNHDPLFTVNLPALAHNQIYANRGMGLGLTGIASLLPLVVLLLFWSAIAVMVARSACSRNHAEGKVTDESQQYAGEVAPHQDPG